MLMSLYPIGCNPVAMASHPDEKGCVKLYNKAASCFNTRMKSLVHKAKKRMPGSNLVYVNAYDVIMDIVRDPNSKGLS